MNLSTLALLLLLWQMLRRKDYTSMLNDDTQSLLKSVENLGKEGGGIGDVLSVITNPAVMSAAKGLFDLNEKESPLKNDEDYTFRTPSPASKEFFRPIDKIADAEIKSKLYDFYDNWYVK